jgi:hypothetical protein
MLFLTPNPYRVSPTNVPGYSDTTSSVRVSLTGGEPEQEHEVRVNLESFDALLGGHRHDGGVAPSNHQPTINGGPEATCTVTTDTSEPPSGECFVTFESSDVGGAATLRGEIVTVGETAETTIDVGIELLDASPLFGRPNELLRSPDMRHVDSESYWLFPPNAGRLRQMASDFESATRDPVAMQQICGSSAPIYPDGLYMSFNDMSLPRGGLFDVSGSWTPPHASHRKGTGIDINGTVWGVVDGLPTSVSTCLRRIISQKCADHNGFMVREATLHCELR